MHPGLKASLSKVSAVQTNTSNMCLCMYMVCFWGWGWGVAMGHSHICDSSHVAQCWLPGQAGLHYLHLRRHFPQNIDSYVQPKATQASRNCRTDGSSQPMQAVALRQQLCTGLITRARRVCEVRFTPSRGWPALGLARGRLGPRAYRHLTPACLSPGQVDVWWLWPEEVQSII